MNCNMPKLRPCPFCGANPEFDTYRNMRRLSDGDLISGASIFCPDCHCDMTVCRDDLPELTTEELLALLAANWNRTPETEVCD